MQAFWEWLWNWLGKVDVIIGVGGGIFGVIGLFGRKWWFRARAWWRRRKKNFKAGDACILAVYRKLDPKDKGVRPDPRMGIDNFIDGNDVLKAIPIAARAYYQTKTWFGEDDMDGYLQEIMQKLNEARKGCKSNTVHLFLDTTVVFATMITGPLYNAYKVHLYHWIKTGYVYQGTLNRREKEGVA